MLHAHKPLIKVMEFVGQSGTKGKKGLTQKEQLEVVNVITSTLLSSQNKRNLCYGPIQVTGVLRNFYCNF